jgi:UDP-3-O-[3-hydroxymyristoyl] glucosamine N-acyltransferase
MEYLVIGENTRIAPSVLFLLPERKQKNNCVVIGNNVVIRDGSIVYGGVVIGDGVTIDHYCIIREGTSIGDKSCLLNFTEVNRDVKIGVRCRISGLLANRAIIGDNYSCFGHVIHNYPNHGSGFHEATPIVGDNVIVGRLAILAGKIKIPSGTRINAGQIVTERNIGDYINVRCGDKSSNK